MPERRRTGYLDRLVDQVSGRRARSAARTPRQLAWGPTRPAGSLPDDEAVPTWPVSWPAPAPAQSVNPEQPQGILRATDATEPRSFPATPPVDMRPPMRVPARTTTVREVVREPAPHAEPQSDAPVTRVVRERTERTRETVRHVEREPRDEPAAPVSPHLPAAVTRAMDRLGALSIHVPPPAVPVTARPPVETTGSRPAVAPERAPERQPAVLVAPRPVREEQPTRAPQVHIGSIEVTVAAPPAPPAAPMPPALRAAAAPPPAGRLSRPADRYGFGQG